MLFRRAISARKVARASRIDSAPMGVVFFACVFAGFVMADSRIEAPNTFSPLSLLSALFIRLCLPLICRSPKHLMKNLSFERS
jgi:hypothetical protein